MTGNAATPFNGEANATFDGSSLVGPTQFAAASGNNASKYRMWGNSATYGIGMVSGQTLGYLTDYAMTFQMNNQAGRGWKWQYESQAAGSGAMSLTTDGKLYVGSLVNSPEYLFRSGGEITSDGSTMRFTF
jgi:hypothetical protein